MGNLKVGHQMLITDIVDEVIIGTDIMNAYRFVINLIENNQWVGQDKINFRTAGMARQAII